MYKVPDKFYARLHHPRPRFKNDIESVLLFMASEVCALGEQPDNEFHNSLFEAIRHYPGNYSRKKKTLDNWRTEISSLLGLIEYTDHDSCKPSALAKALDSNQDLLQFFRYFCFKFQYPGGHLKPHEAAHLIMAGVRFKPAKYIISTLQAGRELEEGSFGISKAEATHCIFNDLRVTRDGKSSSQIAKLIIDNRASKVDYDRKGDTVRYAGDILDYMVLANILSYKPNGLYYLKTHEPELLEAFTSSNDYFTGYDHLYKIPQVSALAVRECNNAWFQYVNEGINPELFQADISDLLSQEEGLDLHKVGFEKDSETGSVEPSDSEILTSAINYLDSKRDSSGKLKTKDIGDVGEAIIIQHEKVRLTELGRKDLASKVVKYPESLSAGFDIKSYEGLGEINKFIEVKTTVSKNRLTILRFKMTPNEWGSAETHRNSYYVFRLMITNGKLTLFVLKDPVGLYKQEKINIIPRHGVDITYNEQSGQYEKVLI